MYISLNDVNCTMVSLIKLVKGMVFTALFSKTARDTLTHILIKPLGKTLRLLAVSTVSMVIASLLGRKEADRSQSRNSRTVIESFIDSMLSKPEKGNSATVTEKEAIAAISAILATLMRSVEGLASEGRQDNKSRVIESNDYKVIYDR